jgi:hypothetical protein
MTISKRPQQKFADFCTDYGDLRTIRDVFEAEDFEEADHFNGGLMGERRTLVASFHSRIDFDDETQQRRLLRVYLHAIDDWGRIRWWTS